MTNIDHSKKSTKISHTANFFAKCSFFFTNLSQGNFLYCPQGFWYYIKFLLQPALLLKWNKTCCIELSLVKIFVTFAELLKLSLNIGHKQVWSFSHSCKISVFNDDRKWTEETILVLLSRMIIISCGHKYPAGQVQI